MIIQCKHHEYCEPRIVVGWDLDKRCPCDEKVLEDCGFLMGADTTYYPSDVLWDQGVFRFMEKKGYPGRVERSRGTYLAGYPVYMQDKERPTDGVLLLSVEESAAATALWGDGTAHIWLNTGEDFAPISLTWGCNGF